MFYLEHLHLLLQEHLYTQLMLLSSFFACWAAFVVVFFACEALLATSPFPFSSQAAFLVFLCCCSCFVLEQVVGLAQFDMYKSPVWPQFVCLFLHPNFLPIQFEIRNSMLLLQAFRLKLGNSFFSLNVLQVPVSSLSY